MSHPSRFTLAKLAAIADDLHDVFGSEGHTIDKALEANPAFGKYGRRSQSSLGRDLAVKTIVASAQRESLTLVHRNGGLEIQALEGSKTLHFRLLKGTRAPDGEWRILTNSKSALLVEDESNLFTDEHHVFSWGTNDDNAVTEVLTARIVDYIEGNPGHLVLDQVRVLGSESGPADGHGFIPTDDDLPGFENEGDEDGFGDAPNPS